MQSAPTQREFCKMVVMKIPAEWYLFGMFLNIPLNDLDAVATQYHHDPKRCFIEVYKKWESEQPLPFTWSTVINTLDDMDKKQLVRDIKNMHLHQ